MQLAPTNSLCLPLSVSYPRPKSLHRENEPSRLKTPSTAAPEPASTNSQCAMVAVRSSCTHRTLDAAGTVCRGIKGNTILDNLQETSLAPGTWVRREGSNLLTARKPSQGGDAGGEPGGVPKSAARRPRWRLVMPCQSLVSLRGASCGPRTSRRPRRCPALSVCIFPARAEENFKYSPRYNASVAGYASAKYAAPGQQWRHEIMCRVRPQSATRAVPAGTT